MLDREIMFKQLQEVQRQKKLRELNDAMHNNYSPMTQYGLLNNGVQVRDASQMFMFGDTNTVHGLPNRLVYPQTHFQGPVFSQGGQTKKLHEVNNHERYKEFGGIQQSGMEYVSENQKLGSLDPLEQKILFNLEENVFEQKDNSSDFGFIQSGSMSALMNSAVAEVSNGDSGLSFQNPEISNENQTSKMVEFESGKQKTPWMYNNLPEEVTFKNSNYSGMKKEDGEKKSTFEVKHGIGQQVVSSRRQPNTWVDVPFQQNPPSTSYGQGSSKMHPRVYHGPAVSFGCSSIRGVIKKERIDYDNIVPQVTSLSPLNSVKARVDQCRSVGPISGTHKVKRSSSIYSKQLNTVKENMVILNSKKRKLSTFKEVTEDCTRVHDMSNAEVEWANSVNRIPEKVVESILNIDRKRRRIILTTQLMQMLFRAPPNIVMSKDATKDSDSITYYVAKFGLGDVCKTSRSIRDKNLLKVVQGFIDRSKKLEDMFSRLEKGDSTILDIKVEFQDLDKFSVINRFAKFHSRGPCITSDTSSSNGGSTMRKLNPQRYVTSSEMPSVVPEGQYCLLL